METKEIKITTADPSALGLFGLAMVTLVASSQKLGWTEGLSFVIPWAIFLGALAQIFAAIGDSKRNNVFGTTAFGAYGLFWLGVACSWLIQMGAFGPELQAAVDSRQLGFAFLGYFIFTMLMTFASLRTNKVLAIIFVLIDFLFLGLWLSTMGVAHEAMHTVAAVAELLIAIVSFYGCGACVINATYGYSVLPQGKYVAKK